MRESEGIKSGYLRQCETRGLSEATIYMRGLEIDKLYGWLSRRKPALKLPEMAGEEVISYIKSRAVFRSKVTVYGVVSKLRDFGIHCGTVFATHLLKMKVNLVTLRDLLGHRQLSSTQIYLHMTAEDLREAVAQHPIANLVNSLKNLIPGLHLPFQYPPGQRFAFNS